MCSAHGPCMFRSGKSTPVRGGARTAHNVQDPKVWMHTFAMDRIRRDMPNFSQATASFLLRAEARTVTAVMNAKSAAQLVEVMEAAQRRADITQGTSAASSSAAAEAESNQQQLLTGQNIILGQLTQMAVQMFTNEEVAELYQAVHVHNIMYLQHVQQLNLRIQQLEERVQSLARILPDQEDPSPTPIMT